jgi:hypothetical protein
MLRWGRVALVTVGLTVAGAALGALAAGVGGALFAHALFDVPLLDPSVWLFVSGAGALCGLVLLPMVAWLLLRAVPLGRAFVGVTWGALVGGLGTALVAMDLAFPLGAFLGAATGVVGSAVLLRRAHLARTRPSLIRLPRRRRAPAVRGADAHDVAIVDDH